MLFQKTINRLVEKSLNNNEVPNIRYKQLINETKKDLGNSSMFNTNIISKFMNAPTESTDTTHFPQF